MMRHQAKGLSSWRSHSRNEIGPATPTPRSSPVLGIVSGKGGVGKSTLAINVATAASASGARTLLVDGDLGLANADLLMGMVPSGCLEDWLDGDISFEEAICHGPTGLEVLISGTGRRVADRIRSAVSGGTSDELGQRIDQQDLTVLDLGAGIGDRVLGLASSCDLVWLVVTPEPTSLADAYVTAKKLWRWAPALRIELVVNRVHRWEDGARTHQSLNRLVGRFLSRTLALRAVLPEDPAMLRSVARQTPVVLDEPNSKAARRLRLLTEALLEEDFAESRQGSKSPGSKGAHDAPTLAT